MTLHLEGPAGVFNPWTGQTINGRLYSRDIEDNPVAWPPVALASLGLYKVADPGIPEGKRSIGVPTVARVGGIVTFVYALEDAPAPHPSDRPLSARQLRLGLIANGFSLASIVTILDAIADPVIRDQAQVWWEFTPEIVWGHDWTQILIAMMNIPLEAAATMWMEAWEIVA